MMALKVRFPFLVFIHCLSSISSISSTYFLHITASFLNISAHFSKSSAHFSNVFDSAHFSEVSVQLRQSTLLWYLSVRTSPLSLSLSKIKYQCTLLKYHLRTSKISTTHFWIFYCAPVRNHTAHFWNNKCAFLKFLPHFWRYNNCFKSWNKFCWKVFAFQKV